MSVMLFHDYLKELANPSLPLRVSRLARLSHLAAEQREAFLAAWPKVNVRRRRQVVYQLMGLTEDNVDLNFDTVFLLCLDDEDAQMRREAIRGLWEYEGCDLTASLLRILGQDNDAEVRAEAALALGRFVLLFEYGKLRPRYFQPIETGLRRVLTSTGQPEEVRARALEAIASCSSLAWIPQTIQEAHDTGPHRLRISALHAMGQTCDPRWLPILFRGLCSQDVEVRYEAAMACGTIADERALPHLAPLLCDQDAEVQTAAIAALGEIGGAEAKALLQPLAQEASPVIRETVWEALNQIDADEDPFSVRQRF
jgi:HEAT repeat protein